MILLPGAAGSSESKLPPHQPRDSKPTRQARDSLTTSILHCAKLTTHHTLTTTDTTEHHFTTTTEPQPETTTKLTATKQVITTNSKLHYRYHVQDHHHSVHLQARHHAHLEPLPRPDQRGPRHRCASLPPEGLQPSRQGLSQVRRMHSRRCNGKDPPHSGNNRLDGSRPN